MNAFSLVNGDLAVRLVLTLLHFLWQGCAVAALAVGFGWVLRKASANARYLVYVIALLLMVVCLPVTFSLISVPSAEPDVELTDGRRPAPASLEPTLSSNASRTVAAIDDRPAEPVLATTPATSAARLATHTSDTAFSRTLAERLKPIAPYSTVAYLVGVMIMLLRFTRAITKARRLQIHSLPVTDETLLAMTERQARRMGLRVVPALAWCRHISVPVVVGIMRPAVLLPAAIATGLAPDQVGALLTHELTHVRRYDLWINLFQRVAEAVLFFHPAVWYVSRRVSIERERACDDSVLSAGWRGVDYAEALVRMAELCLAGQSPLPGGAAWLAASGDSPTQFKLRVMRLLGGDIRPQPAMPRKAAFALLAAAIVAFFVPALLHSQAPSPEAGAEAISGPATDESSDLHLSVERSIQRAVSHLESQQRDDGSWQVNGFPSHDRGGTALAALALLQSGRTAEDESVRRAAEHMSHVHSSFTYTVALQTLFFCALDPHEHSLVIRRNVQWLVDTQTTAGLVQGGWSYGPKRTCRSDGSNTRFAVWAIDAARRAGIDVPEATWRTMAGYWLSSQLEDGSWSYAANLPDGTATMTLAGIACLSAAGSAVGDAEFQAEIDAAIARAWKQHDGSFSATKVLGRKDRFGFYALHCLAVAGRSSRYHETRGADWYAPSARLLLESQETETGAWVGLPSEKDVVATSFALLFLKDADAKRSASDGRITERVTERISVTPTVNSPNKNSTPTVSDQAEVEKMPHSPRPTLSVELLAEQPAPIGEYIVRLIYRNARFVSETSLHSGNRFDKTFLEREVGRTGRLLIDVPGFAPTTTPEFTVDAEMDPLKIDLEPAVYVPVRGQAIDAADQPLAGVRVRVRRIFQGSSNRFPWGDETVTDADGRFLLKHLRAGEHVAIHVSKEGLGESETESLLITPAEAIELPPLRIVAANQEVSGVVTDQDGLPVPAAEVAFTGQPASSTVADVEGRFRLSGLPPGRLQLSLTAPDKSQTRRSVIAGSSNVRLFLPLRTLYDRPEYQLSVELRTADGKTPENAKYYIADRTERRWRQSGGFAGKLQKQIDLHSPIRRTPNNKLALVVHAGGYAAPDPIEIVTKPAVEPIVVELQPAPMATLRGRVVDAAGEPVAGAAIGASLSLIDNVVIESWRYVSNMPKKPPVTDSQGRFTLSDLHRGTRIAVYANADGFAGAWSKRVTIGESPELTLPDLQLLPATRKIQGRVTDTAGQPIANARVRVHNFSHRETRTGADGRFELTRVADGDLTLAAGAASYDNTAQRFSAAEIDKGAVLQLRRDPAQFPPVGG